MGVLHSQANQVEAGVLILVVHFLLLVEVLAQVTQVEAAVQGPQALPEAAGLAAPAREAADDNKSVSDKKEAGFFTTSL